MYAYTYGRTLLKIRLIWDFKERQEKQQYTDTDPAAKLSADVICGEVELDNIVCWRCEGHGTWYSVERQVGFDVVWSLRLLWNVSPTDEARSVSVVRVVWSFEHRLWTLDWNQQSRNS